MVVNQSQRPRFYENQYLGAEDLTAVVEYERIQHARHALGAHTWGIAIGLQLKEKTSTAGGGQVDMYITPGYAWDGFGRPIVVLAPYKIPAELFKSIPYNAAIDGTTTPGHLVQVWLRYTETEMQGPRPGFGVCDPADQFARVQESFQIEVGDRLNPSDQRDPIVIAGRTVDAAGALQTFDPSDPSIDDASIPYQTFPEDDPNALWLIPLGFVRWKPNPNPGQPGNFVQRTPDDMKQSRGVRQYIGVVAEGIQAADGLIHMRYRTKADPMTPRPDQLAWPDELVRVEGKLRIDDDARLFGGKLDFRDDQGQNSDIPLEIKRNSFTGPSQPGGGAPPTVTELQISIGQNQDGNNRFAVGPIKKSTSPTQDVLQEKFTVRADGLVGIGTTIPRNPLGIRGTGSAQDLISFEDPSGTTKWHINQNPTKGNSGLNFAETNVADSRLFIQAGGNVGIGTTAPSSTLHIDVPFSPTPISALSVDVESFVNIANAQASHFFRVRDIGAGSTPFYIRGDGHVGIGTTEPKEALDVRGNIKLNSDGTLYAPGGKENLRIIRGRVKGIDGSIIVGQGFTPLRLLPGTYIITFVPEFPSEPSGSVTLSIPNPTGGNVDLREYVAFAEIDNKKAIVFTGGSDGTVADRDFSFVIMGPR